MPPQNPNQEQREMRKVMAAVTAVIGLVLFPNPQPHQIPVRTLVGIVSEHHPSESLPEPGSYFPLKIPPTMDLPKPTELVGPRMQNKRDYKW